MGGHRTIIKFIAISVTKSSAPIYYCSHAGQGQVIIK